MNMLTHAHTERYDCLAAEKKAAGHRSPMVIGGRTATSAVFFRPLHGSFMGRPCGRPKGLPVPITRSANPHGSAHPFRRGLAGSKTCNRRHAMSNITILSTEIRQNGELFSLNDLHKASGGEQKHRPKYWLENKQTQDLIAEISKGGIPPIQSKQGLGTYACRELVVAYAAWISAAFHLKVIRVFLDAQAKESQLVQPAPTINIRELLTGDNKAPEVPISAELTDAIDKKAFEMAGEALQLCRTFLRRRVTERECGAVNDRFIFEDKALEMIRAFDLGDALAYPLIDKIRILMGSMKMGVDLMQTIGKKAEKELDEVIEKMGVRLS